MNTCYFKEFDMYYVGDKEFSKTPAWGVTKSAPHSGGITVIMRGKVPNHYTPYFPQTYLLSIIQAHDVLRFKEPTGILMAICVSLLRS